MTAARRTPLRTALSTLAALTSLALALPARSGALEVRVSGSDGRKAMKP